MKVLITTDLFVTETNGVVTSVRNLREELEKDGHEVRILTFSNRKRSYKENSVYYLASVSLGFIYPDVRMPIRYRHHLVRELIAWKPDVIHSQCEFFSFQYAKLISRATDAPIIHTYHTLYEQYVGYLFPNRRLGEWFVGAFSRRRLQCVDRIIAPTRKVEQTLLSYGVENSIDVIPSGISLEQHQRRLSPEERQRMRAQLGISEGQTVLLNLGRLGSEKNTAELIDFFHMASGKNPDLVFLIVGDGPEREALERRARALGDADKVIFTGMVPPSEVQNYYQLGDIFVSASTSETQGLTYLEAMANGLPLVCRKDPCLRDVLFERENGFTYTCAEEFLEAIRQLDSCPGGCRAAGERSAELAHRFDKAAFAASVEKTYLSAYRHGAA